MTLGDARMMISFSLLENWYNQSPFFFTFLFYFYMLPNVWFPFLFLVWTITVDIFTSFFLHNTTQVSRGSNNDADTVDPYFVRRWAPKVNLYAAAEI